MSARGSQNLFKKIAVYILFGLLILSFAAWGIGDYLTGPTDSTVATVGDVEVDGRTFSREASRRLQLMQRQQGLTLEPRQALEIGIYDQVLSALVDRASLDQAAAEAGLAAPDAAVRTAVHSNRNFVNEIGQFDQFRFEQALRVLGYPSEAAFVEALRGDLVRNQLESSITAGIAAGPDALAEAVVDYQTETRDIAYITLANESLAPAPEPTAGDLEAWHKDHPERFSSQERRTANVMVLTPAVIAADMGVSDAEIAQAYENRIGEFSVPATRSIRQAIFDSEDAAQAVLAGIGADTDFTAAVTAALGSGPADLGAVRDGDLPEPLGPEVMKATAGSVVGPVQTGFGWHLVQVYGATESSTRPLDEVRDELAEAIRLDKAVDRTIELSQDVEDELATGATLPDVARTLGLPLRTASGIDRQGDLADGTAVKGDLPSGAISSIFTRAPGDELRLEEAPDGGSYIVEVTGITPPALRPLDEVREAVLLDWQEAKRAEAAATARDALVARIRAGESLDTIATETGHEVKTAEGMTRLGGGPELPSELRDAIFAGTTGDAAGGARIGLPEQVIAVVTGVGAPTSDGRPEQVSGISEAIAAGIADDILDRYRQSLHERFDARVNRRAMIEAIDPGLLNSN
ncbi:MAG: SurA N-terminal domain-containing protein [Pseudomonadota bacterium]|nr:SurA N-terminal domain-containing protein [Pseudomonadota bacterium]